MKRSPTSDRCKLSGFIKDSTKTVFGFGIQGWSWGLLATLVGILISCSVQAGEADLAIPDLHQGKFNIFGGEISAWNLLFYGALVITGTLGISLYLRAQIKSLPAHKSMLDVAEIIYQTCRTY